MPFPSLRSRPGTSASQRPYSTVEVSSTKLDGTSKHNRGDSLKRLSLHLSKSNGESFQPFFTHEPEELESRPETAKPKEHADPGHKASSSPALMEPDAASTQTLPIPDTPILDPPTPTEEPVTRPQRFSLLRFKNASDTQLSSRFRRPSPHPPEDAPPAPAIITTAPTNQNLDEPFKKNSINKLLARAPSPFRKHTTARQSYIGGPNGLDNVPNGSENPAASTPNLSHPRPSTGTRQQPSTGSAPPAYGDDSASQLAIPVDRLSDSSRSDGSDNRVYAQTTTTHTISTTTTFFKLKRRKKDKGPLFPLPERINPPSSSRTSFSKMALNGRKSISPSRKSTNAVRFDTPSRQGSPSASPTHSTLALTNAPFGSPGPSILRKESIHSGHSTPPVTLVPPRLGARGRSSTMGSLGRSAERLIDSLPQPPASTRTSTSTTGRRSFGDLLNLPHRLRQNSVPPTRNGTGNSPGTPGSKSNSLQIPRDVEPVLVYPKREENDTPASYLEKLEGAVPRSAMSTILCKHADEFSRTCLRKYMRGFSYFGESIDMSIRKMLMEVELPKETQQIDRLLAGFADRYYECNPGIFVSTDEATFVAFSILLLHSDTHNKNNKRKMTKLDYFKNTQQGLVQVSTDILDCFYDNICYTPFIHFDDEVAINSHRLSAPKPKKSLIRTKSSERLRGPVDPYLLLLDNKLDMLRPSLKDVMDTEDTYKSTGTASSFDINDLHKAFLRSSNLQIVSARSRPDAFMSQATIHNPAEAQAGLVNIKIAKVGLLWRKDPKKKKAQRPWQEWGAILTDSKLYFFKDVGWVKKLSGQYDTHSKGSGKSHPLTFKPPVSSFEPDALMAMDDAVALLDSSYKKHKNAFTFIKHGGFEEVFLANSESEMNDWIGKLNYAATFRTAGVRMRILLEGRHMIRKDSELSTISTESQAKETPSPNPNRKLDAQAAWEIMFYRRQLMHEKISDLDEKLASTQKELENLLRNARHLLVLLPVQAKTREAVVLAAGRMSAKLKWTRVELWRAKTHREILVKDLEQEYPADFPVPKTTPQKATPVRTSQLGRTTTETSQQTLSPVSSIPTTSRRPSQPTIETVVDPVSEQKKPKSPLLSASPVLSQDEFGPKNELDPMSQSPLVHHASVTSSLRARLEQEKGVTTTDDSEERVLREAGLIGVDGAVPKDKRLDTSGSDRDRVGAISPSSDHASGRGSSVRRTLQRSLRDSHGSHHHAPSFHKHKKGRESGSSLVTDDGVASSLSGESNELRRGTGSFILHGKKASVITMSGDWQAMSNEERMRLRREHPPAEEEEKKDDDMIEEGVASQASMSRKSSVADSAVEEKEEEDFVDAKTSVDGQRLSVFVDAKEARSRDSREVGDLNEEEEDKDEDEDEDSSDEEDHDRENPTTVELLTSQEDQGKGKQKATTVDGDEAF